MKSIGDGGDTDAPLAELAALRDVSVPPALVARVMTQVVQPTPPGLWTWLRRPARFELRVSPLGALGTGLGVVAAGLALLLGPLGPPRSHQTLLVAPAPLSAAASPQPVLVRFVLEARGAKEVMLAGSFNDWSTDAVKLEDANQDGLFVATVPLRPGLHEYMFLVDGVWVTDPAVSERRPDGFGRQNALLRL